MILSDFDLEHLIKSKRLLIKPFEKSIIRENGLDLRLADEIAYHKDGLGEDFFIDPSKESHVKKAYTIEKNCGILKIPKRSQVLLSTYEYISLPDNLVGFVELRSTWARHGLSMPPTIIDAGFSGNVTLEVFNNAPYGILLRPKTRFAHIIFATTMNKVKNTYKGKYLGQRGIKLPKVINE
ncbi:MAG: dCTP deaminase [Candidatus Micrarchaeaceae archaeon]